ncbi:MAG: L-2-hydroxyglutarate oxidase [Thermotogae bacterium]|nr:L-2-hydroxyglutarate oxidase [Thermotogota bacterium]
MVVVCGGGVVGLTIARELALEGADVMVIEKEEDFGLHASGRNSGVLHAGIYYTPDSLKAKFAIEGNRLLRKFVKERGIPINESGKVIVARDEEDHERLLNLYERAKRNGAKVHLIDERELAEIEPNARTYREAIYSPNTAVVNPKDVMEALAADVMDTGRVRALLGVRCIRRAGPRKILTSAGTYEYDVLINAAGAHAEKLAHTYGVGLRYRLIPFKGTYRKLKRGELVRGNIYPVPHPKSPFLGVHFTRDPYGNVFVGPTAIPALGRENYGLLEGIDLEAPVILYRDAVMFLRNPLFRYVALREPRKYFKPYFYRSSRWMLRNLEYGDIVPSSKVGIRAQLVDWESKELVMDFVIEREEDSIHILNAVSPAFTASFPFARYVVDEFLR